MLAFGLGRPHGHARHASECAAVLLVCALSVACDRSPPEPSNLPDPVTEEPEAPTAAPTPACVVQLPTAAPTPAANVEVCPVDPEGRPTMLRGKLRVLGGAAAPELDVELATSDLERAHGLMFRPTLGDDEGMLFSWAENGPRSFWMHNTCLALDMLFIDKQGFIVGVLEQVPPWNDAPRRVGCPSAHVLEVRAGWSRAHGVVPGQKIEVETSP